MAVNCILLSLFWGQELNSLERYLRGSMFKWEGLSSRGLVALGR